MRPDWEISDRALVIAVVDDDELVRESLSGLLRSYGVDTVTFDSADALLAATNLQVDCIISDFQMPGTTGLQLLRIMRQRDRAVPVIITTAYPERMVVLEPSDTPRMLIEKPVDSARLIECIQAAVGRALS